MQASFVEYWIFVNTVFGLGDKAFVKPAYNVAKNWHGAKSRPNEVEVVTMFDDFSIDSKGHSGGSWIDKFDPFYL